MLKSEERRWSRSAKLGFAFALVILVAVVALLAVGVFVEWWPWDS